MQNLVKNAKKAGIEINAKGEGFEVTCSLIQMEAFGRACVADYVETHSISPIKSSIPTHDMCFYLKN